MRLVGKVSGDFFKGQGGVGGGDGECFPCVNQRFGGWGQVRGEETLCCQFKAKPSCVDWQAHSAKIYSYQPMISRTWLVEKVGEVYCLGEGEYFFSVNNQRNGRSGKVRKRHCAVNSKQKSAKNLFLVGSFLTC